MALSSQDKKTVIDAFAVHTTDTGSTEVQVALLTQGIKRLTEHCQTYKKDLSGKRGLMKKVDDRKGLLRYLTRTDKKKYIEVVKQLGLRK